MPDGESMFIEMCFPSGPTCCILITNSEGDRVIRGRGHGGTQPTRDPSTPRASAQGHGGIWGTIGINQRRENIRHAAGLKPSTLLYNGPISLTDYKSKLASWKVFLCVPCVSLCVRLCVCVNKLVVDMSFFLY